MTHGQLLLARRAFALAILSSRIASGGVNTDAFRHALKRLDRAAYFDDGYYGRRLNGGELTLDDNAVLSPDDVTARAQTLARRPRGHDHGS
ncbi:SH3-like domain-containing protein [Streptomyces sp. 900105755]|uniref:SH3-like domain-containing protein n=1 Tax=unclassified Streptomyces TaxID=2593676 RepID=UPI000899CE5F|nr:SH3-like domain-containing protein [Streptomyces sp. Ag109_O5-10]SEE96276.1 nitrile hydratase [Streptomyces sp. Ag109_O5-10]